VTERGGEEMSNKVVEMARFKLAAGADETSLLKEAEAVQKNFLEKQSGYVDLFIRML
jgi:hypothetical protein